MSTQINDRLKVELELEGEDSFIVQASDLDSGELLWATRLDATIGHGELFSRASRPMVFDKAVLVQTFGEHYRGATAHNFQCHCLSLQGELLWTHPWQLESTPISKGGTAVIAIRLQTHRIPPDGRLFQLLQVGFESGRVRKTRFVDVPMTWVRELQQKSWPGVRGTLKRTQSKVAFEFSVWLPSASKTVTHSVGVPWKL